MSSCLVCHAMQNSMEDKCGASLYLAFRAQACCRAVNDSQGTCNMSPSSGMTVLSSTPFLCRCHSSSVFSSFFHFSTAAQPTCLIICANAFVTQPSKLQHRFRDGGCRLGEGRPCRRVQEGRSWRLQPLLPAAIRALKLSFERRWHVSPQ